MALVMFMVILSPSFASKPIRYSLSGNANITQNGLKVSENLPIEKKIEIFKQNIKFIGSNDRKNNLYNDPNGKWTLTKDGAIFEINGVKQTISFNKDKVIVEQSVNGQTKKFGLKVVEPTVQAPTAKNLTTVEKEKTTDYIGEVLKLVNIEREKEGLKPLTLSKELTTVADTRSKEIIQLFDHARPDGGMFYDTLTREQKIKYFSLGENIASGQITPEEVVKDWMKSPGHRANIMRPDYNTLGLSIAYNDKTGEANWVQIFGKAKVVNPADELVLKKVEPTPAVISTPKPTAKPVVKTTPKPATPTPTPVVEQPAPVQPTPKAETKPVEQPKPTPVPPAPTPVPPTPAPTPVPPTPEPTQTCWDGSVIPASQACPVQPPVVNDYQSCGANGGSVSYETVMLEEGRYTQRHSTCTHASGSWTISGPVEEDPHFCSIFPDKCK